VIFCQGKTTGQIVAIAERLEAAGGSFLATRVEPAHAVALAARFPRVEVNELGRTVYLASDPEPAPTGRGTILVCTAGTSDLPVAEEAA
jgi:NCAIR mutase (PurE)-related protein